MQGVLAFNGKLSWLYSVGVVTSDMQRPWLGQKKKRTRGMGLGSVSGFATTEIQSFLVHSSVSVAKDSLIGKSI